MYVEKQVSIETQLAKRCPFQLSMVNDHADAALKTILLQIQTNNTIAFGKDEAINLTTFNRIQL